jgi:hypothetical protein
MSGLAPSFQLTDQLRIPKVVGRGSPVEVNEDVDDVAVDGGGNGRVGEGFDVHGGGAAAN